jgi:hypothetical protein
MVIDDDDVFCTEKKDAYVIDTNWHMDTGTTEITSELKKTPHF